MQGLGRYITILGGSYVNLDYKFLLCTIILFTTLTKKQKIWDKFA